MDTGPQHSQRWKLLRVAPRADPLIPKWGGFFKFMLPIRNKQDRVKSSEIFPNKLPKQQTGSAEVFLTSGSTVISNSVCPGKHTDLCVRGLQQRVYGLFKLPNWLVEKWSCHFYLCQIRFEFATGNSFWGKQSYRTSLTQNCFQALTQVALTKTEFCNLQSNIKVKVHH